MPDKKRKVTKITKGMEFSRARQITTGGAVRKDQPFSGKNTKNKIKKASRRMKTITDFIDN